uniref:Uncharacterized protein n=1 Tax=Moschus moschiferus TaxID=68415 RepID=A0A8C6FRH6_MOSMO
ISLQKFQQKALKQTKQKKSKSAEFLMVKEDGEAMEGTGNPAFNMSSPDLSAQQASEKKVIRHDTWDRTLAAHQQKCRLRASAEPKGVTSALIIFTLGDSRCGKSCPSQDFGIPHHIMRVQIGGFSLSHAAYDCVCVRVSMCVCVFSCKPVHSGRIQGYQ